MTIFAVDKYVDRLFTPAKKEMAPGWNSEKATKHHYFDTENEAKNFIIQRAFNAIAPAEDALILAQKRHQKCLKKYGSKS